MCGGDNITLICGLGNPGAEYDGSRHNAGFMVIDRLMSRLPEGRFETVSEADSIIGRGRYRGRALYLQKPQTFMNLSGKAVAGFAGRRRIKPEEILIISDDLYLEPGRLRLRTGGGDGGHNGLKSVIASLGTDKFNRLRVGIGKNSGDAAGYVLGKFPAGSAGEAAFSQALDTAAEAVLTVLSSGMSLAMNRFNTADKIEISNHQ